ncbi:MAG: hypothetical protein C4K60_16750 [Ideonella sp. MAG2]|nr:MAG: hypothetical protein C4K60_16750 [Ideonella sp. MAG2]
MRQLTFVLLGLSLTFSASAQGTSEQAHAFANIFISTCAKHVSNLDALRARLRELPQLPPEKAQHFLAGKLGKAWPVPDKHGIFVLAMPDHTPLCAVYARRVQTAEALALFRELVAKAPAPLVARELKRETHETPRNGTSTTVSYEWSVANAPRRMLFMLTTSDSASADIQGMASASLIP